MSAEFLDNLRFLKLRIRCQHTIASRFESRTDPFMVGHFLLGANKGLDMSVIADHHQAVGQGNETVEYRRGL